MSYYKIEIQIDFRHHYLFFSFKNLKKIFIIIFFFFYLVDGLVYKLAVEKNKVRLLEKIQPFQVSLISMFHLQKQKQKTISFLFI